MKIKRILPGLLLIFPLVVLQAQDLGELTIKKIMRDKSWIGSSPGRIRWSLDGSKLYFSWNPEHADSDSLYSVSKRGGEPVKVSLAEQRNFPGRWGADYSHDRTRLLHERGGDIYILNIKSGREVRLTQTLDYESNPKFSFDEKKIIYKRDNNLYMQYISGGRLVQLTNFTRSGSHKGARREKTKSEQLTWVANESLHLSRILSKRKARNDKMRLLRDKFKGKHSQPLEIVIGEKRVQTMSLSPDEKFIFFSLYKSAKGDKRTIVPSYVTESGYTENLKAHSKVGGPKGESEFGIYDIKADTIRYISVVNLPGINTKPDYLDEYQNVNKKDKDNKKVRKVIFRSPIWSADGRFAVFSIYSVDHKDRWICQILPGSGQLKVLDHQHDEAWIGGPGIGPWQGGIDFMPNNHSVWFQSETSGYSHLYTVDLDTGKKTALTTGKFEIYGPHISKNKKYWYFTANKVHPGVRHFYRMPLHGGKMVQITSQKGSSEVTMSPDEKTLAIRFSTANRPWGLYLMKNKPDAKMEQITKSISPEFLSYNWRMPKIITFKAQDGAEVHARLYQPEKSKSKGPAVIFVHGAGYLQNAHCWWSHYYREYFFHNLLVDKGYTVLDIDYRGSAGYGRDWRTAIYRWMGGKDLSDQVDGAEYLVNECNVDEKKIGIYGGSYGGFITLMAMFNEPDVFAAGAALRSVTDWAHYHDSYTANILNTPVADSDAYRKSSPIYFAEGLKGALLMCHGMVDVNVHFQDIIRLSQRLIELGKENWELAVYPVEGHGFREPSSWTDEYRRILKLFEDNLK